MTRPFDIQAIFLLMPGLPLDKFFADTMEKGLVPIVCVAPSVIEDFKTKTGEVSIDGVVFCFQYPKILA